MLLHRICCDSSTVVYAFDDDNGPNGTVHYFIQSGDPNGYFLLDEMSGALTLGKRLPNYALGEHTLHLEARDGGEPSKSATARLIIEVDESIPKGLLGPDLYASHSNSLFDSGSAGHTFNLYILIAIVVASAVVSALLLFSIFFLLRRSRRARSCRHVAGCGNGTRMTKSNSTDPITDKYNSPHWPLTGRMTSPTNHMDERRQLYGDMNYRAYSPLLDGPNSIDLTDPGGTFCMQDANGMTVDKRHATLINPHLYSVGSLIKCDPLEPSHVELYIPSSEPAVTSTTGHYLSGEQVTFYRPITAHETSTPTHGDVLHHSNQTFTLPGTTKYSLATNGQSGQAHLDG
ncbi:unnamed protein product, partial [Echinostoma caproni]|uniref:CA domain-containing protein n=1 Tax=Echinostoma caproni TaxID=27848 RepID=A0A183AKR0_9TREM